MGYNRKRRSAGTSGAVKLLIHAMDYADSHAMDQGCIVPSSPLPVGTVRPMPALPQEDRPHMPRRHAVPGVAQAHLLLPHIDRDLPLLVRNVGGGPVLQQHLDGREVHLCGSEMQGSVPLPVLDVRVSSVLEDHLHVAGISCQAEAVQAGLPRRGLDVHVGTVLHEMVNHEAVALRTGLQEGAPATRVAVVGVGAPMQQLEDLHMVSVPAFNAGERGLDEVVEGFAGLWGPDGVSPRMP
mmetsp:Transcript_50839/g.84924  ORF Transcript_50839/g.84924 Transcript_50839/m.84924 type:complete len:239 (-) Transcript_50839:213-929(-)